MNFFLLLSVLLAPLSHAEDRILTIRAANGSTAAYDASAQEPSGCNVGIANPTEVKILSESDSHFEVEWKTPMRGCMGASWFGGLSMKHGFIRKEEILWTDSGKKEELPAIKSIDMGKVDRLVPPQVDCTPPEQPEEPSFVSSFQRAPNPNEEKSAAAAGLFSLINHIRREQAGLKSPQEIDKYMSCYPLGKDFNKNYSKLGKYVDLASDVFRVQAGKDSTTILEVHPSLLRCLLRRESGFDPKIDYVGGTGLGQHTSINIKDINERINKDGSWEQTLWRNFFARVKESKEGRAMLANCPGSAASWDRPVFGGKADALCPLQSIAASGIYNLLIQRDLMKASADDNIAWENELDYQLAVAAAYNLGNGDSKQAVNNLSVTKWIKAILRKSSKSELPDKEKIVRGQIEAVRNCMQDNNWKPMAPSDHLQCELSSASL